VVVGKRVWHKYFKLWTRPEFSVSALLSVANRPTTNRTLVHGSAEIVILDYCKMYSQQRFPYFIINSVVNGIRLWTVIQL
jgi:hypothetical protein